MSKKITLAEVAAHAHVAIGTASEALNRKTGVSAATRERVIEAARQLGYDQRFILEDHTARNLKTVGVIKHEQHDYPGFDPFYFPVIAGVEHGCQAHAFTMSYATCDVDIFNRVTRLPSTLVGSRLDGLIVVGSFLGRAFAREIRSLKCPVVLVDGYAEDTKFDRVLTNNVDGAYEIVSYLIQNGHRHIGLIGTAADSYPSIRERREGYQKALQRHGIDQEYIEYSPLNRESAHQAMLKLLARAPQVTALFVVNDNAAFGAIAAARTLGYQVPDTLSVVGFDDIVFAADMVPPLTTMRVDKTRMGEFAVQTLVYRAAHPDAPIVTTMLDTTLVVRGSVRPARLNKSGLP